MAQFEDDLDKNINKELNQAEKDAKMNGKKLKFNTRVTAADINKISKENFAKFVKDESPEKENHFETSTKDIEKYLTTVEKEFMKTQRDKEAENHKEYVKSMIGGDLWMLSKGVKAAKEETIEEGFGSRALAGGLLLTTLGLGVPQKAHADDPATTDSPVRTEVSQSVFHGTTEVRQFMKALKRFDAVSLVSIGEDIIRRETALYREWYRQRYGKSPSGSTYAARQIQDIGLLEFLEDETSREGVDRFVGMAIHGWMVDYPEYAKLGR
jgi:hypothetical protein